MKKGRLAVVIVVTVVFGASGRIARAQLPAKPCANISEFVIEGYPLLARQARIEGDVNALVELRKDGTVASISEVTGPDLLRGSADSIKSWRFDVCEDSPGSVRITLRFNLSGPEDVRNVVARVKGKLPYFFEITTNPTAEKPGPNVGQ